MHTSVRDKMLKMYFNLLLIIPEILNEKGRKDVFDFIQHDYKLEFERWEAISINKQFVNHYSMVTYKYNRTTPVVNLTFSYKIDIGEETQMTLQAYKFLSNEYREFPMRFQVSLCDAIRKNMVGLGNIRKCGNCTGCEVKRGRVYHICKWSPDQTKFPPLFPNGRYMLEIQQSSTSTSN